MLLHHILIVAHFAFSLFVFSSFGSLSMLPLSCHCCKNDCAHR